MTSPDFCEPKTFTWFTDLHEDKVFIHKNKINKYKNIIKNSLEIVINTAWFYFQSWEVWDIKEGCNVRPPVKNGIGVVKVGV